jgi:hypothetical protein
MRTVLIIFIACVSSTFLHGCSAGPKPNTTNTISSAEAKHNTTDISVDQRAGTFVALARRDHTTNRVLARCGTVCPSSSKLARTSRGFGRSLLRRLPLPVIQVSGTWNSPDNPEAKIAPEAVRS